MRQPGVEGNGSVRNEQGGGESESKNYVTGNELAEALEHAERRFEAGMEARFRTQSLAVGSLRTMIADTDSLLERLLERLTPYPPRTDTPDEKEQSPGRGRAD